MANWPGEYGPFVPTNSTHHSPFRNSSHYREARDVFPLLTSWLTMVGDYLTSLLTPNMTWPLFRTPAGPQGSQKA